MISHTAIVVPDESLPGIRVWCAARRIDLQEKRPLGDMPAIEMVRLNDPIHLSQRELDVLNLIADGAENRQIARRLGLSHQTIKTHVARITRKLAVHTRAAAIAEAIRHGYIT